MRTELVVRFEYGSVVPWASRSEDGRRQFTAGPDRLILDTKVDLRGEDWRTVGEFDVAAGQEAAFTLTWTPSFCVAPVPLDVTGGPQAERNFWRIGARRSIVQCNGLA